MTHHIMIDLETLGTTADAVILSIGAVRFDLDTSALGDCFYTAVTMGHQRTRYISPDTVAWWKQQTDEARAVFDEPGLDLTLALVGLGAFIAATPGNVQVWSNGADFDLPMLAHAFLHCGVKLPWKPYAGRCYRTYKNLPGARAIAMQRQGQHHNALDDAIDQARHLCAIHRALFGQPTEAQA